MKQLTGHPPATTEISALEAHGPAQKVMMEIDVAVFTFDQQQRLRIVTAPASSLWDASLRACSASPQKSLA